jgi:site-specific recombinase XerC
MNSGKLKERVQKTIKDRTGLDINPHLFRHLAAKIHLDQHPGEYETVRRVLGHRSIATTTSYYTGLEVTQALKHYDQTILGYRDDSH